MGTRWGPFVLLVLEQMDGQTALKFGELLWGIPESTDCGIAHEQ